jgi:hypothetical protein
MMKEICFSFQEFSSKERYHPFSMIHRSFARVHAKMRQDATPEITYRTSQTFFFLGPSSSSRPRRTRTLPILVHGLLCRKLERLLLMFGNEQLPRNAKSCCIGPVL